jgi:hypothetical protein
MCRYVERVEKNFSAVPSALSGLSIKYRDIDRAIVLLSAMTFWMTAQFAMC